MNILAITKGIAGTAASLGVGTVIGNAVKATSPLEPTKYQKVAIAVGGFALSSLAGEVVTRRTERKIDELSKTFGYPPDVEVEVDIKEN